MQLNTLRVPIDSLFGAEGQHFVQALSQKKFNPITLPDFSPKDHLGFLEISTKTAIFGDSSACFGGSRDHVKAGAFGAQGSMGSSKGWIDR